MCKSAMVDGEECDDTKTLSEKLGVPVILHDGCDWEPDAEGECLCNCDVPAMAKAAGVKCKDVSNDWDKWAFVDWVLTKK